MVTPAGLLVDQVVEVIVHSATGAGDLRYGSGYRIGPTLVVTASHVVDAGSIEVRFSSRHVDSTLEVPAGVVWRGVAVDIALLKLEWPADIPKLEVTAPALGDVPFTPRALPFQAVGFPAHKARKPSGGRTLRDSDQVTGEIPELANIKTGYLDLHRDGRPLTLGAEWRGISGAAVFAHDLLVGVTVQAEPGGPLVAHRIAVPTGAYRPPMAQRQESEESVAEFRELLAADGVSLQVRPARRRPTYVAEIEAIAAGVDLRNRGTELAELAAFALAERPYAYAWWQADPWAGKTALAAQFATAPPAGVEVVAFFISRTRGQQTAAYFAAITDQLASILEEPAPAFPDTSFTDLWVRAGTLCERAARKLLLLVDGLDENADPAPIAARLPTDANSTRRVALLSRPHPDVPREVSLGHPIRDPAQCPRLRLSASPYARNLEQRAHAELGDLLEGDLTARRVLGLLALAGPLTTTEASNLLRLEGADVEALDVRRIVQQAAARVLCPMTSDSDRYAFQHDTLREIAIHEVGAEAISVHREAIDAWADQFTAAGWPDDTPEYLLTDYPTLLVVVGDSSRLAALTSTERISQLRLRTGDDTAAIEELTLALHQLANAEPPDLPAACKLTIRRENLKAVLLHAPIELVRAHAALGELQSAYRLALFLGNPNARSVALATVASMAVDIGQWDTARAAAKAIEEPMQRAGALAEIAQAAANNLPVQVVGELLAQALHAATTVDDKERSDALAKVAQAAAVSGRAEQASDLLTQAESATAVIDDAALRSLMLAEVAEAAVAVGPLEHVENLLRQASSTAAATAKDWSHYFALATIARVAAAAGLIPLANDLLAKTGDAAVAVEEGRLRDLTLAEIANAAATARQWETANLASDAIQDQLRRTHALLSMAQAATEASQPELTRNLVERAASVAATIDGPADRARALVDTAMNADTRETRFAMALLDKAEQAAAVTDDPFLAAKALADVAYLAATVGLTERGKELLTNARHAAAWIEEMAWRDFALASITDAAASAGQWDTASRVAAMVEEPSERVMALATVAQAAQQAGQRTDLLNQAKEAATEAETDPLDRARVLTALVRIAAAEGSEEVADLLEQASQTAAAIDDPDARVWTLTVAVRVAADAGRTEKVVELLTQASHAATAVKDPTEQASARATIALAGAAHLAAAGRREEVAELLAQASHAAATLLKDPIERPYVLATLGQVAIAGQVEQASELLARAEHAAATIEEPVQRAHALAAVAQAAGSRTEHTTELLIQAKQTAGAIEDPSQRVEALGDIAGAAANIGRLEDALLAAEAADTVIDHASGWTRGILIRARVLALETRRSHTEAVTALVAELAHHFDPQLCGLAAQLDVKAIPVLVAELNVVPPRGHHRHHWSTTAFSTLHREFDRNNGRP